MCSSHHSELYGLKFLKPPLHDVHDDAKVFSNLVSYNLSSYNLSIDKSLFNTILEADDGIIPISTIHSMVVDFGFSLGDVIDLMDIAVFADLSILNKTHCRLDYRIYKLYHAIAFNIYDVLSNHGSVDDPTPWIDLKELTLDSRILTTDIGVIIHALASSTSFRVECRIEDEVAAVRRTPNIEFFHNGVEVSLIDKPYECKSEIDSIPPHPGIVFRRAVTNAYKPLVFNPTQLHIYQDSAIVSTNQLMNLFPSMKTFFISKGSYYLTVDNHSHSNTSEFLVPLYHTIIRVEFASLIMDATFSIYDSSKYRLIWCDKDEDYSLLCRQQHHSVGKNCVPNTSFLGERFTVL